MKVKCNLTVSNFCQWVNEKLLPNKALKLGFPRSIAIETAHKWMHEMVVHMLTTQQGSFVNGKECQDGIECCSCFLNMTMEKVSLKLNFT